MLLFAALMTSAPLAFALTGGRRPGTEEILCAGLALTFLLCAVGLFAKFFTAAITLDEAGLTQRALFVRRFIAWEQVQDFYESGNFDLTFGNIIGRDCRIRFWYAIADANELKAEIARRAVNSRAREWGKKRVAFAVSHARE